MEETNTSFYYELIFSPMLFSKQYFIFTNVSIVVLSMQAIFGKIHLILDSVVETDIILEFNLPHSNAKTSSWSKSSNSSSPSSKPLLFVGHCNAK